MQEKLHTFLRHARAKGLDYGTIRSLLLAAGWKERDIAGAIASDGLELPVPEPARTHGARDAFLYLLTFALLYITVWSVGALYFIYLEHLYPDPAWPAWPADALLEDVRRCIAASIVGFPLFVVLTTIVERALPKAPDSRAILVRKWLTYATLLLAAGVIVGDAIALLFLFLNGSLITRFVLKSVVVVVIAQIVLSYYFLASQPTGASQSPNRLRRSVGVEGVLLVAGAMVLGFSLAGSPFTARQRRLDTKRVEDLRAIHHTIQEMATQTDKNTSTVRLVRELPKTLDDVAAYQKTKQGGRRLDLGDPQTGVKYVYTVTGEKTYELGATFELAREEKRDLFWNHPAGRHGFRFSAESPP